MIRLLIRALWRLVRADRTVVIPPGRHRLPDQLDGRWADFDEYGRPY